jgi:type III pantothenate kinase
MSVWLATTPWFTKNLAAGDVDTVGLPGRRGLGALGGRSRWYRTVGPTATRNRSGRGPRIIAAMLLAIDIGNTNITLGTFRAGALASSRRAATVARATADELELLLDGLLRLDDAAFGDIDSIAVASVVPALTAHVETIARRRDRPLTVASAGTVPLAIRVDRPSEVGADRLINALAVARLYGTPAVVVDFGTATTLDCVATDGAYVGGAIAPGLELGLEALAARTAKLPRIELRAPDRAIGRDTVGAMQSGTVFGYQALAAGLLARVRRELADIAGIPPAEVRAILTGGLSAAPWAAALDGIDAIDPDLTLKGLAILHAEVAGGERLELGLP